MPVCTTPRAVRVFLAPINRPTAGEWHTISHRDPADDLRAQMEKTREETGARELCISDAQNLPRRFMPPLGGVPVEQIAGFVRLAEERGHEEAEAFVEVLDLIGIDPAPEDWPHLFDRSHAGVQDSRTAWAESRILDGAYYPHLFQVATERGLGYINVDRVRSDMEHDGHTTFVETADGCHLFHTNEL